VSILDYVPDKFKDLLWPHQERTLLEVEAAWNAHQVIVLTAPVGSGKSLIAMTIAAWRATKGESTANVLHRVALQNQYKSTFPQIPNLRGKARYDCHSGGNCLDTHTKTREYCPKCPYQVSVQEVTEAPVSLFNYQSYLYSKLFKQNLILDEGHVAAGIVGDMFSLTLWRDKHEYPETMKTHGDVATWLEGELKRLTKDLDNLADLVTKFPEEDFGEDIKAAKQVHGNYTRILRGLQRAPTDFYIEKFYEEWASGEVKEGLRVRPVTLSELPPILWPQQTKKIVILSATFIDKDLSMLGLKNRSIAFIESDSPIPVENRKIIVDNPFNMGYKYQEKNLPAMAEHLEKIFNKHPDCKGMVHIPYSMRATLQDLLAGNSRLMWHDSNNKDEVLAQFKAAPGNQILMASGFQEGVDLRGKEFGFQIITKVMWPTMTDKLNEMLYREDPDRMLWETVRSIIQMTGRICRGPDDEGLTYIVDAAFGNVAKKRRGLYQRGEALFPNYVKEAIEWN
jgi:Rad3-related DNA helicase